MRGFASIFKNGKMCANSSHLVLTNDLATISLNKQLCDRRDPSHISTVLQG